MLQGEYNPNLYELNQICYTRDRGLTRRLKASPILCFPSGVKMDEALLFYAFHQPAPALVFGNDFYDGGT